MVTENRKGGGGGLQEGLPRKASQKRGAIGAGPDQVPLERQVGKAFLAEQSARTEERRREALSAHREFGGAYVQGDRRDVGGYQGPESEGARTPGAAGSRVSTGLAQLF